MRQQPTSRGRQIQRTSAEAATAKPDWSVPHFKRGCRSTVDVHATAAEQLLNQYLGNTRRTDTNNVVTAEGTLKRATAKVLAARLQARRRRRPQPQASLSCSCLPWSGNTF